MLTKLSAKLGKYLAILEKVSGEYFDFFKANFAKAFARLETDILKDRFLDLFAKWLQSKDAKLKEVMMVLTQEIEKRDPSFKFNWDEVQNA